MRKGNVFEVVFTAACLAALLFTGCSSLTSGDTFYTVRYDGNGHTGGSVPKDNNTYRRGMIAIVSGPKDLAREGSEFAGWNIKANGLGISLYHPGESIKIETANVVLYAQWRPKPEPDIRSAMP